MGSTERKRKKESENYPKRFWDDDSAVPPVKLEKKRKTETDMLNTKTGGAYIPPAKLRLMQAQITDKASAAFQRLAWEALKKSIHGHINKINTANIGIIIKELLKENIVRGRGLLCRSIIQAQSASPTFTNVYAALVSAINSRFPNIGELLLKRLIIQFKRGFKRNDKSICMSSVTFIAHLVNQKVAHEILALEILTLLVETPTDDSVEVAIAFIKQCGQKLTEVSPKGLNAIFELLRNILHEGKLDKRVQYMIEVLFQVWKDGFKDHPAVISELEVVPEEEQLTHLLLLEEATDSQDILNVFKLDEKYEENEEKYKTLREEILGSDADSDAESGSGEEGDDSEEDSDNEEKKVTVIDNTETNLVALRRTIYLTINSSLDFEECAHKLMKMEWKPGQEIELCHMFLDCCAEQRTYEKFYGLLAQRFCSLNRIYVGPFEEIFKDSYGTAHRLDTNRLRNVAKFFAHLMFTDSISWEVLECVKLNEEDTTSSSRIYIKILFQELAEYMGLKKLNERLRDPTLQQSFYGLFPRDNPNNTRFSINFFTSIGLGGLTDDLREHLKQMPKVVPQRVTQIEKLEESSDSSSSDSSSDSSSSSSEDSDDSRSKRKGKKKKQDKTDSQSNRKEKSKMNKKHEQPHNQQDEESAKNYNYNKLDYRKRMEGETRNKDKHDDKKDNKHKSRNSETEQSGRQYSLDKREDRDRQGKERSNSDFMKQRNEKTRYRKESGSDDERLDQRREDRRKERDDKTSYKNREERNDDRREGRHEKRERSNRDTTPNNDKKTTGREETERNNHRRKEDDQRDARNSRRENPRDREYRTDKENNGRRREQSRRDIRS